jgi:hypothetical protein
MGAAAIAATSSTVRVAVIEAPHATVPRRVEETGKFLAVRNRRPAMSKPTASTAPNGDHGRKQRPRADLLAPMKAGPQFLLGSAGPNGDHGRKQRPRADLPAPLQAGLQPLVGNAAPGRRVPLGDSELQLAPDESRALANPKTRLPPSRNHQRAERPRGSNREPPIAISCSRAWPLSNDPSLSVLLQEAYRQFAAQLPQSGNGLARKAGPSSPATRFSPSPNNSPHPSSKRSGSTEPRLRSRSLIRSPFETLERRSSRRRLATKQRESWTASFVKSSTVE